MRLKTVAQVGCNFWWILALLLCVPAKGAAPLLQIVVQSWATWTESPPSITIHWVPDSTAVSYSIFRKLPNDDTWTGLVSGLAGNSTAWTDENVQVGIGYEYQIRKTTNIPEIGYGYLYAGIRLPLVESRGKAILLVEKSLAAPVAVGLARFEKDLIGDGWTVVRHEVDTNTPVTEVKQLIKSDYQADPQNTKSLILFGHIPVPYSGNIAPDGHDDHRGAWPADVYYGEFDGEWTDTTVNTTNWVGNPKTENHPGDGKFDQGRPPGKIRLQIGRIDLSNLTCFANKTPSRNEVDLARQYLDKDHTFRHGLLDVPRRGLLYIRGVGAEQEPQVATAFRNFRAFVGTDQKIIGINEFLPTLNTNAYLWSYVVSAGDITECYDVASSDHLAVNDPKTIFTSFMGSYFGDWDRESGFLRATLGTTSHILTTFYGGQPQWILHPMSLGETIGNSAQITQNNGTNGVYEPHVNFGVGEVHIALLGDPTLRMHPVRPPTGLRGSAGADGLRLDWTASSDPDVLGYHVYKSSSANGPFARLNNGEPLTGVNFVDPAGTTNDVYMVRAIKLEETLAGSYFNASQGVFYPNGTTTSGGGTVINLTNLVLAQVLPGGAKITWEDSSGNAEAFQIERRTGLSGDFQTIASVPGVERTFIDQVPSAQTYTYRVKGINSNGEVAATAETVADLRTPDPRIVGYDDHGGDWKNIYGQDGYVVYDAGTNLPPFLNLTEGNSSPFTLDLTTEQEAGLMRPDGSSRLYSFRVALRGALEFQFLFNDSRAHRVAIYVVDPWDTRYGRADLIDPFRNVVLDSLGYGKYPDGKYLLFDIQRYATVRIKLETNSPGNAIISGMFFMPAVLQPPVISPPEGGFPGKTLVSMTSPLGGVIRYTLDGSDPTENSPVFTAPFSNTQNVTIKARAYKDGYDPSAVTTVTLTNNLASSATFVSVETTTQGDWPKSFGQDAYKVSNGSTKVSDLFDVNLSNVSEYLWNDNPTELRAPRKNPDTAGRVASCWYSATDFKLDVTGYVEEPKSVALYFMDWDRSGRVQDVIVSDPAGNELDRRRIDNFADGKYLVWNVRGAVRFTIRSVEGPNALLNGFFVGGGATAISPSPSPARLASSILSGGAQYQIRLYGQPGQVIDIESSSDFKVWTVFRRVTFSGTVMDWTFSIPDGEGMRFFRATVVP